MALKGCYFIEHTVRAGVSTQRMWEVKEETARRQLLHEHHWKNRSVTRSPRDQNVLCPCLGLLFPPWLELTICPNLGAQLTAAARVITAFELGWDGAFAF